MALAFVVIIGALAGLAVREEGSSEPAWAAIEQRLVPEVVGDRVLFRVETRVEDAHGNEVPAGSLGIPASWHFGSDARLREPAGVVLERCAAPPECRVEVAMGDWLFFSPTGPGEGFTYAYDTRDGAVLLHVGDEWLPWADPASALTIRFTR